MKLIEDTRQQAGRHDLKHEHFKAMGVELIRSKLPFGDYALPPRAAVDTKASMQEIAQNIGGTKPEHERFKRELVAARDAGCKLFVLVENHDGIACLDQVAYWVNPRLELSPKAINGPQLCKAMKTMQERYGVTFVFCRPEEAAERVEYLLREANYE